MTQATTAADLSPEEMARIAKLRYVKDEEPGFTRKLNGHGFKYLNAQGRLVRDKNQSDRIKTLAIPPAWTEVWICRFANGHLQATGQDDRGRKQYLYHDHWREISNAAKFWRLKGCPRLLPALRKKVSGDLRGTELTRSRVLAGMVALLDDTSIRVGNEEYVRDNGSYGLATLRTRHVQITGGKAMLRFRAKSGLRRESEVSEKRLVRLLKELKKLPGTRVFRFRDDAGELHDADATTVNAYLAEITGQHFTAKDFRTWKGSSLAAGILFDERSVDEVADRKKAVRRAITAVSEALGNTPATCRKYYIHAGLLEDYLGGKFPKLFGRFRPTAKRPLSRDEQILSRYLPQT